MFADRAKSRVTLPAPSIKSSKASVSAKRSQSVRRSENPGIRQSTTSVKK